MSVARPIVLAVVAASCWRDDPWPRPEPVAADQFATEFAEWRQTRRARLVHPGSGPVTWIGLWELQHGKTTLGSDSTLAIVLPRTHAPRVFGTLTRSEDRIRFDPAPNAPAWSGDSSLTPITAPLALASDRTDSATVLAVGALRMRVHGEPGTDRLWLRVWDINHPARASFQLPDAYSPDSIWRVAARFVPFEAAQASRVADIAGGHQVFRAPGELVFRVGRGKHRLTAFADSTSRDYFVMFWDSTATTTTYEGGRYLRVPFPDSTGWTVVDFNRAYNPPCVFTPYSTCALPPRENRLALVISAGEKRAR